MRSLLVSLAMTLFCSAESYPGAWVDTRAIVSDEVYESPAVVAPSTFKRAVLSWNADLPLGGKIGFDHGRQASCVQFEMQAGNADRWLPWQPVGTWAVGIGGASLKAEGDTWCKVDVDTLVISEGFRVDRFRYRARRSGPASIRLVAVATWTPGDAVPFAAEKSSAWGKTIDVPRRSQMVEDASIRGDICSPASLAMVLEHHGVTRSTREVADGVYDQEAKIYGNWPLNTAYAALVGMKGAYVAHFRGIEDLEREIEADRPVVISHKWKEGELTGAPVQTSNGHLIVVVGFTETGDVVVNDPAAHPDQGEDVRRVYPRKELYHTWLENASGMAYVVRAR